MKIGLLADIHGNSLALDRVLKSARTKGIKKFLIAGDVVGYYFFPKLVLNLLNSIDCVIVKGNHEEMLRLALNDSNYLEKVESKYGPGLRFALDQLSISEIQMLTNLPHPLNIKIDEREILLCHGSPNDINKYLYPDNDKIFSDMHLPHCYDLIITGHTHYQMCKVINKTKLVNPGSVGQPRDCRQGAQWAIYDTISTDVEFLCENYDVDKLENLCRDIVPSLPYLADVLKRTR